MLIKSSSFKFSALIFLSKLHFFKISNINSFLKLKFKKIEFKIFFLRFSNASFMILKSNSSFLQFGFLIFSNEITVESTFGAGKKQFLET